MKHTRAAIAVISPHVPENRGTRDKRLEVDVTSLFAVPVRKTPDFREDVVCSTITVRRKTLHDVTESLVVSFFKPYENVIFSGYHFRV
jgi:hypothetical protein